jgi:transposase
LSKEEKNCDCCGEQMKHMGTKTVREVVQFVPASLYKEVHIQHSYECNCHEEGYEVKPIKSAKVPDPVIQRSLAGASVLAWLLHQKFELHLPLYRQVDEWHLYGLEVSRQTLANWVIISATDWLKPLYDLLFSLMITVSILHADETKYQVINRSDGKPGTSESRIWEVRTARDEEQPIIYYHSSLTRGKGEAKALFKDFIGHLQTDGYSAYQGLPNVIQVGCWSHGRRKFLDVGSDKGKAGIAVRKINKFFELESEWGDLTPVERKRMRNLKLSPLFDEFYEWLTTFKAQPKSKLETAVGYVINQKVSLLRVLDNGRLELSNNCCEALIRPIALGRKNHLFSTSEKGATANVIVYTMVHTAKANGLNVYKYLSYLFTHLPNTDFQRHPELLEDFLPWSHSIQQHCR